MMRVHFVSDTSTNNTGSYSGIPSYIALDNATQQLMYDMAAMSAVVYR